MSHSLLFQLPRRSLRSATVALHILAAIVMSIAGSSTAKAQIFTTIYDFCSLANCADGYGPYTAGLVQGTDGNFYGVTYYGGASTANSAGTVFQITSTGMLTTLYSFCTVSGSNCPDGANPVGLVKGTGGTLYGVTSAFGPSGSGFSSSGMLFSVSSGSVEILAGFCDTGTAAICAYGGPFPPDGGTEPLAPPILGSDGNLYGTTATGGNPYVQGVIYEYDITGGNFSWIDLPCSPADCGLSEGGAYTMPDGSNPHAPLVLGSDGNFYGTMQDGTESGATAYGTVFKLAPGGGITNLYSFCNCATADSPNGDGASSLGALVEGTDGNFYGVTAGIVGPLGPGYNAGTVFKITPSGTLTTLHNFCSEGGCADGAYPIGGMILATDGNFYGTTQDGGAHGQGTVFQITPAGTLTTVYSLGTQSTDGVYPLAPLVQGTDGAFYSTTYEGGPGNHGTVFKLVVFPVAGLSPLSVSFPTTAINTTSPAQAVTLTNTTTGSLEVSSVTITGGEGGDFSQNNTCSTPLTQMQSCTINLTYSPTSLGSTSATLTITDNNNGTAGSIQTVALSGTGFNPVVNWPGPIIAPRPPTVPEPFPVVNPPAVPMASLTSSTINFPPQVIGMGSGAVSLKLSNTGKVALAISSIAVSGDFAQTNNCGAGIAAGGVCMMNVTFKPTVTGARQGSLTITDNTNGVAGSAQRVALSGTGIQSPVIVPLPIVFPPPAPPDPDQDHVGP